MGRGSLPSRSHKGGGTVIRWMDARKRLRFFEGPFPFLSGLIGSGWSGVPGDPARRSSGPRHRALIATCLLIEV
jgi:hypothetical protein